MALQPSFKRRSVAGSYPYDARPRTAVNRYRVNLVARDVSEDFTSL